MLVRRTITVDGYEWGGTETVAERELRDPREQVRVFIREGLQRRGLLNREDVQEGTAEVSKEVSSAIN